MNRPTDARTNVTAALNALAIAAVGLAASLLDGGQAWEPRVALPLATLPACERTAVLGWHRENGVPVETVSTGIPLFGNAMLIACPWTQGTLTVTLRGTIAAGIGTRAVLVQGPNRLLDVELRDETRTFEIHVPTSGQLLLAFVNDFYDPPEDRNLWVSGLGFTPRAP